MERSQKFLKNVRDVLNITKITNTAFDVKHSFAGSVSNKHTLLENSVSTQESNMVKVQIKLRKWKLLQLKMIKLMIIL